MPGETAINEDDVPQAVGGAPGDASIEERDEAVALEQREHAAAVEQALAHHSALTRFIARMTGYGESEFLLRVVQPALVGLIDGTVSTLAPIFAAAVAQNSRTALLVGIATALGAGVSMGISEALSDTGEQTNRGSSIARGAITGGATTAGGLFHSLPFLIHDLKTALVVAGIVVAIELFAIAWVRFRFLKVSLKSSLIVVTLGGAIVLAIGVLVGSA